MTTYRIIHMPDYEIAAWAIECCVNGSPVKVVCACFITEAAAIFEARLLERGESILAA